jgi:hypothetical protein
MITQGSSLIIIDMPGTGGVLFSQPYNLMKDQCSRVEKNRRSGQRSCVSARFTRVGAR